MISWQVLSEYILEMTEEQEEQATIFVEEEQSYKDHLKRIGIKLNERIGDEFKRINFIENYYHFLEPLIPSICQKHFKGLLHY